MSSWAFQLTSMTIERVVGNIIAALDTGSGKTLISLLLIKWITSLEKSRGKVVIFLVPKVTLVEQQYAYIKKNSSLTVVKLHGAQDLDLSDRAGWRARFEGCDVLVMTGECDFLYPWQQF